MKKNVLLNFLAIYALIFLNSAKADITISISGFAFIPSSVSINEGEVITFKNFDMASHNVAYVSGGVSFATSPTLGNNGTWQYTPTAPGTYNYRCGFHGSMVASFTVLSSATISTQVLSTLTFCGGNITVPYTVTGTFDPSNEFSVEISSNSFNSTTILSTVSTTTGEIVAAIPSGLEGAQNYRVRVKSSSPAVTGSDNGQNISINYSPDPDYNISILPQGAVCTGNAVTFSGTTSNLTNPTFSWRFNGSVVGMSNTFVNNNLANNDVGIAIVSGTTQGCNPTAYNQTTTSYIATVSSSVTPTLGLNSSANTFCFGTELTISGVPNGGGSNPDFVLYIDNATVTSGTSPFTTIDNLAVGTHTLYATMKSSLTCATVTSVTSNILTVTVNALPATPTISINNITLTSSALSGNQWYSTATGMINSANSALFIPTISGHYLVIVTQNSCSSTSVGVNVSVAGLTTTTGSTTTGIADDFEKNKISLYPNPVRETLMVATEQGVKKSELTISIYSFDQRLVLSQTFTEGICKGGKGKDCLCPGLSEIDVTKLSDGIYIVQISNGKTILLTSKLVKQ